jgi:phosphoglycolate phosphatase
VGLLHGKSYKKEEFIMFGDRMHDMIGAKNTGIASIGVTYGYGSKDELQDANATYIVRSVSEVKSFFV